MELIEVKKFNLGAKGETLYNMHNSDPTPQGVENRSIRLL
jgi:hypothetical protein